MSVHRRSIPATRVDSRRVARGPGQWRNDAEALGRIAQPESDDEKQREGELAGNRRNADGQSSEKLCKPIPHAITTASSQLESRSISTEPPPPRRGGPCRAIPRATDRGQIMCPARRVACRSSRPFCRPTIRWL